MARLGEAWVDLVARGDKFYSNINAAENRLKSFGSSSRAHTQKVVSSLDSIDAKATSLSKTFQRMQRSLIAFAGMTVLLKVGQQFNELISRGIDYNKQLETSRLGIAAILAAHKDLYDASGRLLKGQEELNAAQMMSVRIVRQLQAENLKTAATLQQLVRAYQETLGPGLSAGFDEKQITKFTTAVVQAASTIGLSLDQLAEETRSLLTGTIQARTSRVAVSLGLTNEDIRAVMSNSDQLFNFLMDKLSAFNAAGEKIQQTFEGAFSNLKDVIDQVLGEASAPFFEYLKDIMIEIQGEIATINERTGEIQFNPSVVDFFDNVYSAVYETTEAVENLVRGFLDLGQRVQNISAIDDALYKIGHTAGVVIGELESLGKVLGGSIFTPVLVFIDKLPQEVLDAGIVSLIVWGAMRYGGVYGKVIAGIYAISKALDELQKRTNIQTMPEEKDWNWLFDILGKDLELKVGISFEDAKKETNAFKTFLKESWDAFWKDYETGSADSLDNIEAAYAKLKQSISGKEVENSVAAFKMLDAASVDASTSVGYLSSASDGLTGAIVTAGSATRDLTVTAEDLKKTMGELYPVVERVQKALENFGKIKTGLADELADAKLKLELLNQGVDPAIAGIKVEMQKNVREIQRAGKEMTELGNDAGIFRDEMSGTASIAKKLADIQTSIEIKEKSISKHAKEKTATYADINQSLKTYEEKLTDISEKYNQIKLQASGIGIVVEKTFSSIEEQGNKTKTAFAESITAAESAYTEMLEKVQKADIVSPEVVTNLQKAKEELDSLKNSVEDYNKYVEQLISLQKEFLELDLKKSLADAQVEYANLTGSVEDQINAENNLIRTEMDLLEVRTKAIQAMPASVISDQEKAILLQTLAVQKSTKAYQLQYNEMRKTGSVLQGLSYGFSEMGRSAETAFDLGVELSNTLNDAIEGVTEGILLGTRDIEDSLKGLGESILALIAKIAAQKIVIPIIFQVTGLNSLTSALAGLTGGSGGTANTFSTGLFSGFSDNILSLGYSLYGRGGVYDSIGEFLVNNSTAIGNLTSTIGGITSLGFGVNSLMGGNYIGGSAGIIGGGLMGASALSSALGIGLSSALGPIGAAISALGSMLGGLFSSSDPGIRLNAGASYGSDLFDINYKDVDLSDSEKSSIESGIQAWFDAWTNQFGVVWTEVFANLPYDFKASLDSSDLEEVGDMAKRWSDDMIGEFGNLIVENILGTGTFGSEAFLRGLTGKANRFAWDEGELTSFIESMLQPLYALKQAGTDIEQLMYDFTTGFFGDYQNPDQWTTELENVGEFFKSLQLSGEELSATVGRVVGEMAEIPDVMDRLRGLVDSGMGLTDAFKELEKNLALTKAFITEPIQNMVTTALNTLDFSQAKDALVSGIKQMMVQSILSSFTADITSSLMKAAFDPLGGLTGAIEDAIKNQDYSTLGDQFAAALDAIGPAIDALEPQFQDLFELLDKLGITATDTANAVADAVDKMEVPKDPGGTNKITDAFNAALAAGFRGATWDETKDAFLGSLNDMLKEVLAQKWVDNMEYLFMDAITSATSGVFEGGLQGLMSAYFEGTITSADFKKYISEFWDALGPVLDEMEPKFRTFLEALGLVGDEADAAEEATNNLADKIKEYTDIIDQAADGDYVTRMRELNDWLQEEIDSLNEMGLSAADAADASDLLAEAYRVQADEIRNDLIQAIYEAEQATRDWVYTLTQAIDSLTGGANSAAIAFSAYEDALARSRDESLSTDNRISAINDAKRYLDEYVSATISAIEKSYQTRIDALNSERQTIQDTWDAERKAIEDAANARIDSLTAEKELHQDVIDGYQDQVDALNKQWDAEKKVFEAAIDALEAQKELHQDVIDGYQDQIDLLNDQKDAAQELYDAQIDAAQEQLDAAKEQLALAEKWSSTLDTVRSQLLDILTSTQNPASNYEQLSYAKGEVDRLKALFAGSTGEQQAEYGTQLSQAYRDYLTMAGTTYGDVSRPEYQAIFDEVVAGLQGIESTAAANAADQDALQQQVLDLQTSIESLNRERNDILDGISGQIDSLQDLIDVERDSIDAISDSIDAQREAMDARQDYYDAQIETLQALIESERDVMEGIQDAIDVERDTLEAALKSLEATYQPMLDSIDSQVALLNSQMTAEIESFKASMVPYYEALLTEGQLLYESQVNYLQEQLMVLQEILVAIESISINSVINDSGSVSGSSSVLNRGFVIDDAGNLFSLVGDAGSSIPSFDVGTKRVPFDTLAYLHKDEAVFPAAVNPFITGGSNLSGGTTKVEIPITYAPVFQVEGKVDEKKLAAESERQFDLMIRTKLKPTIKKIADGRL